MDVQDGGGIASSPTVVNGVVYVGSWDGYEYALNAADGTLIWRTNLGITSAPTCNPTSAGVTSVATVQNGVVYVGGGDAYWYALDASTGAVLWKVYTGDNSASGGHYNWASPLLYNGYAYIGIASFGDCPLVQGQVLQVSLSTHQVVNTFNVVPTGQGGGGVWTSPTIDAASNTVYVTTGTQAGSQTLSQAIIGLDAATLTLKSSWQIPAAQAISDSDWGTTPTVFDDATGTHLVAAANKNGYLYAYDRADVAAGPLWQQKIGTPPGSCPQCGDGMASSGAFANGRLYYASGPTTINGSTYPGSVRALDPATGAYLWQHGSPAAIVPAIASANGLIIDGAGPTLEVLNAATGAPLYSYMTGGTLWGAPSVSNGQIFEGSTDGYVYAFSLASPRPSAPVDLSAAYNNAGISDDAAPSQANFDGGGYSYSAQALQTAGITAGGSVVVNGVAFQWPAAPAGTTDNMVAAGQTVSLTTPTGGTTLAVLGAATNGPSTGTGTITYSDGSTQSFTLNLPDWTLIAGGEQLTPGGAQLAASMPYRNGAAGKQTLQTYIFYTAVALQAGKAVVSVTLPATTTQGGLHVFAMTVAGAASSSTATATRTPLPTSTSTPLPTSTRASTPLPTSTRASTPLPTSTSTSTSTPVATSTSTPPPLPANTSTPVAGTASGSISLSSTTNNAGISSDSAPGAANFDGYGYSYSAQALQAAGFSQGQSVTVNGVAFQWPPAAPGSPDNVLAQGQTVSLATPTAGTTLAVLGAASNGPSTGTGTITYSDGSTQSFSLGFSDWTLNGGSAQPLPGNTVAATLSYRNNGGGKQVTQTHVFYAAITLQAGKAVASVTLPTSVTQGHLHVFAMTVAGSASSPAATATSTSTPLPTSTSTSTPLPTSTSTSTSTNTPLATATNTSTPPPLPASTSTSTSTPVPTSTSTSGSGTASGSISLSSTTNNAGISSDSAPGAANFDGYGYSYSAQALQAAGFSQGQSVTVNGVAFQWPPAAPGSPDNVLAQGQTVSLATPTAGTTLAVLGAASNGPSTGTGTITYSDGSTQSFSLGFSDWTLNGGSAQPLPGNTVAATLSYRNNGGGKQVTQTHVFYAAITLQAGKAVASVTLPTSVTQGHLHVFAMTVAGSASSPAATSTSTSTSTPLATATSTSTPLATATNTSTPLATATNTSTPLATATNTSTPLATATNTSTPLATATPLPAATSTSTPATTTLFATGFESGDPQPTWANTVDTTGGGGGILNVGGICCGLSGPEAGVRTETTHTGSSALMYSGMDNSATSSYAYLKVFDLGTRNIVVGQTTALSYWIYPQSHTANGLVSGGNSSCVAVDLVFTDNTTLHTLGAVDQAGNPLTPSAQCGHLTLDTWNHITSTISTVTSGKTISRLDVGYDQPANTGGYRGYIDDISIHN